jgi:hypothetical protein
MRRYMSLPKGLLRLRTSPSTPPLPRSIQEWRSDETNLFHQSMRSSSPKATPQMLWLTTSTLVGAVSPFVHANAAKLDNYKSDDNDNIIAMAGIPQQPPHAPLVHNTNSNNNVGSDNNDNDTESDDDKSNGNNSESNDDKPTDLAAATDSDGNEPVKNQGVQRLRRRRKGITKKYANYSLLMAAK